MNVNVQSKRWLFGGITLAFVAIATAVASQALAGSKGVRASAKGLGPIERPAAARPSDRGERDPGRPEQGVGPPAALQGQAERPDRLVRPARRLGPGDRARPRRQLRAQAQQHRDRRPGGRADGDARLADARTRTSSGRRVVNFQGAPDFSPTRIAEPGPTGFPLAKFQPGAVAGPGYSPFIRIAGSPTVYSAPIVATGDGPFDVVHHTNTGDRVLGIHIAGPSAPGQYAGVVGRPAVREGLRRRPADRLHLDRRRPAADLGARALDLRAGARQGGLQRRRRLPRLRPRAAVRLRQRPDRRRQQGVAGLRAPGQGRPRLRGRRAPATPR